MTHRQTAASFARIAGIALLVAAAPSLANAQMSTGGGPMAAAGRSRSTRSAPPPSALPGAQVDGERVIPADKSAVELSPNDALFDAITRGDLPSAQEAINRGADFNARNVLGLTPLDESIDLGRNNITFLLLSLRGSDNSMPATAVAKPVVQPEKLTRPLNGPAPSVMAPKDAQASTASTTATNNPPVTPSNAPPAVGKAGTPSPQSGFLGFGG